MTSRVRSCSLANVSSKRRTKDRPSRREHLERATGNRRRNRRISSSSSALFDANNETNEDKNEEKTTNETIAGTTKTSRVVDFVAAWDVLSGRLSESSILRSEDESDDIASSNSPSREMLLAALALAIPKLQRMPHIVLDDFNRRHEFRAKNRKEKDDELNGRCPRERAVAMCTQLIDLGMDAECCSAGLLRDASLANEISLETIEQQLGSGVVRVAHDCQRLRDLPERLRNNNNNNNASSANATTFNSNDTSSSSSSTKNNNNTNSNNNQKMLLCDDEYAEKMRTFLLTFHDQRAIVVELASRLDILQHSREIFKSTVRLQQFALETMKVYAPLASALHCGQLSAELEDAAFRALFPKSYESLDKWLRQTEKDDARKLERARQVLLEKMSKDAVLMRVLIKDDEVYEELLKTSAKMAKTTADSNRRSSDDKKKGDGGGENNNYPASLRVALNSALTVSARRKSRFSSMKKILRDGRDRAKLRDLLGVRVILNPQKGSIADIDLKSADMACYRAQQIAHATFSAVKGRTKDYVAKPKKNGYQSLHSALIVSDDTDDDNEDDDPSEKSKNDSPSSSSSYDNNHNNNSHNNGSRTTIELQIRTRRMHASAEIGNAAHSSYKGGFTEGDPGAAKTLKDLVDAANIAAYEKFGDFTDDSLRYEGGNDTYNPDAEDALFRAFDVDKSGSVSVEELKQTIETIWLNDDDSDDVNDVYDDEGENATTKSTTETAETLMKMLDVDADGKISPEEFKKFREFASTFKACSNADEKQSERIRKAVEVEMSSVDDDDEDDEDDDDDGDEEEIVVVDAIIESTVKIDDGKSIIEEGSGPASTSNSARRRIIRGQQQQTQQKVKDDDEIDVDRLVKEVISASGSFDAISSSHDVSSDEKEEKEEILQQSSSTTTMKTSIHDVTDDDDINEKNEKKGEEKNKEEKKEGAKAAQPSSSSPEKNTKPGPNHLAIVRVDLRLGRFLSQGERSSERSSRRRRRVATDLGLAKSRASGNCEAAVLPANDKNAVERAVVGAMGEI